MGDGVGDTPQTAMTTRAPAVLIKKEILTVDQNVKGETQYMTKSFYSFIRLQ